MLRRVFIDGGKKYDKLMQRSEQDDTKIKIQLIMSWMTNCTEKKKCPMKRLEIWNLYSSSGFARRPVTNYLPLMDEWWAR